jgi:hypothetical protein
MGKVINLVGLKLIAFGVRLQSEDQPSWKEASLDGC